MGPTTDNAACCCGKQSPANRHVAMSSPHASCSPQGRAAPLASPCFECGDSQL